MKTTEIHVTYQSIDHFTQTKKYRALSQARRFAQKWIGRHPEIGTSYAVSSDGVGKITVSGDATLNDLFPPSEPKLRLVTEEKENQHGLK